MLEVEIPGRRRFVLENLVLDVNGTIAVDGEIIEDVIERIHKLAEYLNVFVVTAGTHGHLDELESALKIRIHKIEPPNEAEQKQEFVEDLGADKTASMGNGSNDALMLRDSAIGIAVIGPEGASGEAVSSADVVVNDIRDALDLLLKPKRLTATLRK